MCQLDSMFAGDPYTLTTTPNLYLLSVNTIVSRSCICKAQSKCRRDRRRRRANDVRIDCKAAKHSDGDRGAVLAPYRDWPCENRAAIRAWIALVGR